MGARVVRLQCTVFVARFRLQVEAVGFEIRACFVPL